MEAFYQFKAMALQGCLPFPLFFKGDAFGGVGYVVHHAERRQNGVQVLAPAVTFQIPVRRQFRRDIPPAKGVPDGAVQPVVLLIQYHAANIQPRVVRRYAVKRPLLFRFQHGQEQAVLETVPHGRLHAAVREGTMQDRLVRVEAVIVIDLLEFPVGIHGKFKLGCGAIRMKRQVAVLKQQHRRVQQLRARPQAAFRQRQ